MDREVHLVSKARLRTDGLENRSPGLFHEYRESRLHTGGAATGCGVSGTEFIVLHRLYDKEQTGARIISQQKLTIER